MPTPKGTRYGGRKAGTPNKKTAAVVEAIAASGETPLDYMLRVMRDPVIDYTLRFNAAKAAAPFVHPHLSSIDQSLKVSCNVTIDSVDAQVI